MNRLLRDSTSFLIVVVFSFVSLTSDCKSTSSGQVAPAQNPSQSTQQNPPAQQMSVDDLVAPIALYPDQLLAQVLTSAANPQEVLDLGNWLVQNQNLQGDAMSNAAKQAGFSPSAQYLALVPQVVDNMCQQMDWTRQLGEAFKSDQKGVMDAVQRKRTQAQQMGNLQSSPQMTVASKTDNGQQYVQIQPTDPKVVYVPQYNPVTIYNTQTPAAAPAAAPATVPATTTTTATTTEKKSGVSTGGAVAIGLLSFGVGMAVGNAIHDDNYYPYPAWGSGGMYYGGRPYYPPPYRPPVYPGYRPVNGYNPPANYRWNQYNHNVNVNVNNNYYNRFNNRNATYQGARSNLGETNMAANRSSVGNAGNRGGASTDNMAARPTSQPNMNRGEDRGYGAPSPSTRPAPSTTAVNRNAPSSGTAAQNRENMGGGASAFGGGATGNGRQEHEASNRGRSSMGRGARERRGR